MPRTDIAAIAALGCYVAATTAINWTAADVANGNSFTLTGREVLLIRNTDGALARNITLTSIADLFGRLGTITNEAVPVGGFRVFGPVDTPGWQQADGKFYLSADNAAIQFAILRLPR